MSKQTIKAFAHRSGTPYKLIRAVVRQCGGWDEFQRMAKDVSQYGAVSGVAPGFIYYVDTIAFYKRNRKEIMVLVNSVATECGTKTDIEFIAGFNGMGSDIGEIAEVYYNPRSKNEASQTEVYNALAWFVLETVAGDYVNFIEGY